MVVSVIVVSAAEMLTVVLCGNGSLRGRRTAAPTQVRAHHAQGIGLAPTPDTPEPKAIGMDIWIAVLDKVGASFGKVRRFSHACVVYVVAAVVPARRASWPDLEAAEAIGVGAVPKGEELGFVAASIPDSASELVTDAFGHSFARYQSRAHGLQLGLELPPILAHAPKVVLCLTKVHCKPFLFAGRTLRAGARLGQARSALTQQRIHSAGQSIDVLGSHPLANRLLRSGQDH